MVPLVTLQNDDTLLKVNGRIVLNITIGRPYPLGMVATITIISLIKYAYNGVSYRLAKVMDISMLIFATDIQLIPV